MSVPDLASTAPPAVNVDEQTLRYLGYDPRNIATRALVLLAQKYDLDPALGEILLIKTKSGVKVYVSRDGMLVVAHRSGQLDGIVVEQQRRNSTNDGWTAYVSVWRKDMSHPFTFGAQCLDTEDQAKAGNGPEQALTRATRRALRHAFQIRSDFYPDRPNQEFPDVDELDAELVLEVPQAPGPGRSRQPDRPGDWNPDNADQAEAHRVVANLPVNQRISFLSRHRIEDFGTTWPPEAVAEVLAFPAGGAASSAPAGDGEPPGDGVP